MKALTRRINVLCTVGACVLVLSALIAGSVDAQGAPAKSEPRTEALVPALPEIDKIATPVSPALVLLGTAPTSIERPATPSKFALSLANAFTSGSALALPSSYALEVAPFWLVSHPRLRVSMLQDGFGDSASALVRLPRRVVQNFLHTFVVGVASADSSFRTSGTQPADTSIFRLGISARASLLRGHWAPGCLKSIEGRLTDLAQRRAAPLAAWLAANPTATEKELDEARRRIETEVSAAPKADTLAAKDPGGNCLTAYYGWSLDVAAAAINRYPAQSFDAGQLSAHAWWVTLGYKDRQSRSILAVARLGREGVNGVRLASRYTDVGARIVIPKDEWAFSIEGVGRRANGTGGSADFWRIVGGFDYKVSDGVWLNSSFGRDYQTERAKSLVALLGLKWNLGTKSLVAAPKT